MTFTEQKAKGKIKHIEFRSSQFFSSKSTLLVSVISLAVLIFVVGCPPVEPGPAEPPETGPRETEPNQAEPNQVEPNEPDEPNEAGPSEAESNDVEPNDVNITPKVSFHEKCAGILSEFVDDAGMVHYRRLNLKRRELQTLLDEFDKLGRNEYNSWPKEDKIAFWINAWNIQMLRVIIENYPIEASRIFKFVYPPDSIRHIPPTGVVGAAKWKKYKFFVMGEEFTLPEVERRFFRKEFDEPRVFLAITQASLSGPPLRNEPYYGNKLHKQLDDQAEKFLSGFRAFGVDKKRERVYLSALLAPAWYGKEFVRKYGTEKKFKAHPPVIRAALNFVSKYISEQDKSFVEKENYSVKYIGYDWRLNDSSENK